MKRQRIAYPTRHTVGPLELVTFRRSRGYAIRDTRDGSYPWTTPSPRSGRLIPDVEPDLRRALRMAQTALDDQADRL